MTTLPSPPLSVDAPYTSPKLMTTSTRRGHRKEHQRHPERRQDTFELLQALVTEHQRLEQQEYETMLREALPTISCRTPTTPPKGILINSSYSNYDSKKCSAPTNLQSTENTKNAEMTFIPSPPPSSRDNNHSCPTIPLPSSIPVTATSSSPCSSLARIAFVLPPPLPSSSSSSSPSPSPLSSSNSSPSSHAPRHSVVRFSAGPPKIYRYPKSPAHQDI